MDPLPGVTEAGYWPGSRILRDGCIAATPLTALDQERLTLAAALTASAPGVTQTPTVAISGATVIDGISAAPLGNTTLAVAGDRIRCVGAPIECHVPPQGDRWITVSELATDIGDRLAGLKARNSTKWIVH